jgi:amino acid permease
MKGIYDAMLYIVGVLLCYLLFRKIVKDYKGSTEWLVFDRAVVMYLSLFSWLSFLFFLLMSLLTLTKIIDPDKKTKW